MQHGRRKLSHDETSLEQKSLDREKAAKALKLMHDVLEARKTCKEMTPEVNGLTMKALQINPEVATIWNFRRDLLSRLPTSLRVPALEKELELLNMATKHITKSYCVWHQRRWVVDELLDLLSTNSPVDEGSSEQQTPERLIASELSVIDKLLSDDGRNFHVWNYRA
ncbi:Geranylgeranyl transferase type-2 alpha subunit, putative [Perkinsus marinus ATCC 50983]|uniref:Geranylgeranyl transferase type-2 subunit alpha n=1 Tax=Perkinsus marinus (strain ATCC 50983 / TXsc) TaxID=423536 RepID=C5LTW6_PERM5|nr:Geranylgeranyl transferase type-2 alpha subunit, putative [Perkinsus marinus ATCC 50983]EEQ99764.1 Geranylgeranyl transferase type-2 alpha subunit, putative [Perkinsus marinus ATCC 50983]|eukprot:XP_002767047.1 Geranylgeranyl transferase type-2 alpha subunit, putative [Perkinsus marinus ATCC 50983]